MECEEASTCNNIDRYPTLGPHYWHMAPIQSYQSPVPFQCPSSDIANIQLVSESKPTVLYPSERVGDHSPATQTQSLYESRTRYHRRF